MDFIYKNYFKNNLYPTLILKPEEGKYTVSDANEAFLSLMQVDKVSIKDKDFFEAFLSYEENVSSVTTTIVRTSLAYVEAFRIPKKIEKVGIIHSMEGKAQRIRYWEIYIYPIMDEKGLLDFLIYICKNITNEDSQ